MTRHIAISAVLGAVLAVTGCTVTNLPTSAPPSAAITQAPAAPPSSAALASSTALAVAPAPPDAPSYDAAGNIYPDPLCTQVGGTTIAGPACSQIPYLGSDDQTYYAQVPIDPTTGALEGPADTAGTGATRSECLAGYWPEYQGQGPGHAAPGRWKSALSLCQPRAGM